MTEEGRRRKEQREARQRADWNDKPAALEVCRKIRDDETAAAADRLEAIRLIQLLKE